MVGGFFILKALIFVVYSYIIIMSYQWFTGSGQQIEFDEILYIIKEHCYLNGKVYVGTDSFVKKRDCIFSSAICLYGADNQIGGRYFVQRYKLKKSSFSHLSVRMLKEAEKTIEIAHKIASDCPWADLELHLDISNAEKNEGTSALAKMLVGYVKGSGFECKIKPYAFAAASIADKHSK
jgi:predicted RNase H-related nuclease YkuK (DUF458 family)